ncbi:uncharacterized protein LOC111034177 [Myzus persicae]|uniref:uncharacterized protein LOC111034177 n=1 Tax=Myzus persicae TaxID=13164 RepID=UPI000B938B9D|nr:uncharacterized protein LOC111034177 [Myzus persicae]XP_022170948.1 uncharacterized protein LOC111034177 [Myzus persicae]
MADYKKLIKNKYHLNHKSMNGLLLLIYIMVLMLVQHSTAQETGSSNTSCKDTLTCTKCTIKAQCVWSLDQQACVSNTSLKNSSLIVHSEEKCPRFLVSSKREYNNEFSFLKYTVKILNDSVGFIDFLNKNNFTCNSSSIDVHTEINNNEIVCSTQVKKSYFTDNKKKSFTAFIYVKFNGVILWLDNISDHYATIYERPCVENVKDADCATCTWNDDGFSHYVRLCSAENTCEGHNELYMMHNGIGQFWNFTSQKVKGRCAEINVTSVVPLSGSLTADTEIKITVKNHYIFSKNQHSNVTVAGKVCKQIWWTGTDTITCIMSPPPDDTYDEPPSGPVSVMYKSDKGELNVESSQTFQFDVGTTCGKPRPKLVSTQELYGIERGDTNVTLNGFRFFKPCIASQARMFVKLPNGTMQFASNNCDTPTNDNYMVCRTPKLNITNDFFGNATNITQALNFGLEVMNFVGNNSLIVNGSLTSYYHILDGYHGYQLEGFELKPNDLVVVYGNHLQHMHNDILIQFQESKVMKCNVTIAEEHSFQCKLNASVSSSNVMFVNIAGLLTIKVNRRLGNITNLIWLIVMLLTAIVSALACMYLFNRWSDANKTVHNHHPLNLVDLDTQTALL